MKRSVKLGIIGLLPLSSVYGTEIEDLRDQLELMKKQMQMMEQQIKELERYNGLPEQNASVNTAQSSESADSEATEESQSIQDDGISVGGAVRANYSVTSYNDGNKNRGGDFDFDIFRINLGGTIGDVSLNAEIRFFDYMTAVKYAYIGYDFNEDWQVQAGITQVPFGNQPYNSHNYFFSSNYYLGLEDDFDLGVKLVHRMTDNWQLDLAFFKNDELGGVDGYVDSRTDRYSYDIVGVRSSDEGIYDSPATPLGEYNTVAGRFAYKLYHSKMGTTEIGVSALSGGLHDGTSRAGDYNAWAIHANGHFDAWNIQLQHTQYEYNIADAENIAVGAYAFYDSIAAEAKSTTFNVAYDIGVNWGPVTALQLYNNFSLVYDKSDKTRNTMMNVTGVSVAAGGLFTYFDFVNARNQPFVGGSMAGDSTNTEQRFNINLGYYF